MVRELEDELGDILQKARDGKSWSQTDLARAAGVSPQEIRRMEDYELIPDDDAAILKLAEVLDLHGPSLLAIARGTWFPADPVPDPGPFDIECLQVYMGTYPVKCYLLICRETRATAIVDTGANPEAIIKKAEELRVHPAKILLTHAHPDHAGGLGVLEQKFCCRTWVDSREPLYSSGRNLNFVQDGEWIELGRVRIQALSTPGHTAGGVSYHVNRTVFSGDTIFAGSMGRANASWPDLFNSVAGKLLTLPEDTRLFPGHGPATTVGEEKRHNPFFFGKVSD